MVEASDIASRPRPASPGRVARCVLLAGGLKPSPLAQASGMSALDLLIAPGRTVMDVWAGALAEIAVWSGGSVDLLVVHDRHSPAPRGLPASPVVQTRSVEDPKAYRGPAGVVRDVCEDVDPDAWVLVAEAARLVEIPLEPALLAHAAAGADVTVAANPDGTPAGLYLVRAGALACIPGAGFMDLKEQWCKRVLEQGADVRVHTLPGRGLLPLRTREQALAAARVACGYPDPAAPYPFAVYDSRGRRSDPFGLVGARATVGAGALVADAVVMDGADVGPGALVVRSIVCPGARVEPGAEVVDAVVTARGVVSEAVEVAVTGRAGQR